MKLGKCLDYVAMAACEAVDERRTSSEMKSKQWEGEREEKEQAVGSRSEDEEYRGGKQAEEEDKQRRGEQR
jgi:hypothetical protein